MNDKNVLPESADTEETAVAVDLAATEINELHEKACALMKDSVNFAIRAGELLSQKKEELPHGQFTKWVDENIHFTVRTAQSYIKIFKHKAEIEQVAPATLSEAYRLIAPEKPDDSGVKEPREPREPRERGEKSGSAGDIQDDDFGDSDDQYAYWPIMEKIINDMMTGYAKLNKMRDHTTPKALGFMIGNIAEMATRIHQWEPAKLTECPNCHGTRQSKDPETGLPTTCPLCIDGQVGPFKETKL